MQCVMPLTTVKSQEHGMTLLPQTDRLIACRRQQKRFPSKSSSSFDVNYEMMLYNDNHQQWCSAPKDLSHQLSVIGASVSCVLWYSFTFDECCTRRVFWSPGYLSPTDVLINNKLSEECVSSASLHCDYRDKRVFEVSILIQDTLLDKTNLPKTNSDAEAVE